MKELNVMLIAEPVKVNHLLAALVEVGVKDVEVQAISLAPLAPQDVMVSYRVDVESPDATLAHLSWVEDELGPWCKIY